MGTTIMIHGSPDILAHAGGTSGAPLEIRVGCDGGWHVTNIFTDDYALSDKLAAAINDTVRAHAAEKASAKQAIEEPA